MEHVVCRISMLHHLIIFKIFKVNRWVGREVGR